MRVVYTGPFDEVEVPALGMVVRNGVPVEVLDDAGALLCEQSCWERASSKVTSDKKEMV